MTHCSPARLKTPTALMALLGVAWFSACGPRATPGEYPSAPIELVVPFQAGGGSDNLARMIQSVVQRDRLVSQPIAVVNKAGGAGVVGFAYVASKRGDRHTLMTTIDTVVSVPLQPEYHGPTYRDLTIVAVLALDDLLVVVPASSPFTTIEQVIAAARTRPGTLTLATNAAGGEDHVFGGMIEKATGARFSYVHTRGGAEAMQNVMGGHVDIAVPNPSETLSQLRGGLVRALAVGSSKRLDILPEVPTLTEKGIPVEFQMFRGISLPADVGAEVVRYWEGVLQKVTASEAWKTNYIHKLGLTPYFKTGPAAMAVVERLERIYRATLKDLGVIR